MIRPTFCLLVPTVMFFSAGCCDCNRSSPSTTSTAIPSSLNQAQGIDIPVAPEALLQTARKVVESRSLTAEQDQPGSLITSWQPFPGRIHVARRWIERTRFRITVSPGWQDPAKHSRVQVTEETEERAPTSKDWDGVPTPHAERSAQLLEQIRAAAVAH